TSEIKCYTRRGNTRIVSNDKSEWLIDHIDNACAVVVDVGVNRVKDPTVKKGYRLVGDVRFNEGTRVASAITPVPGGVGPMTITMLLYNTVLAARQWVHR